MNKYWLAILSVLVLGLFTSCGNQSRDSGTVTSVSDEPIEVPNVTYTTLTEAQEALTEAGFTNVVAEYYRGEVRNADRLVVVDQSSLAGENVDKETEIILTCKKLCGVNFDILSNGNRFFSKYDMLISFDDKELGKVANGENLSTSLDVVEGIYTLRAEKVEDPSLTAEYEVEIRDDMTLACGLTHSGRKIEFKKVLMDVSGAEPIIGSEL